MIKRSTRMINSMSSKPPLMNQKSFQSSNLWSAIVSSSYRSILRIKSFLWVKNPRSLQRRKSHMLRLGLPVVLFALDWRRRLRTPRSPLIFLNRLMWVRHESPRRKIEFSCWRTMAASKRTVHACVRCLDRALDGRLASRRRAMRCRYKSHTSISSHPRSALST